MPDLHEGIVYGLERCPQCGVATPLISKIGTACLHYESSHHYDQDKWFFTGSCSRCRRHVLFYGETLEKPDYKDKEPKRISILKTYPSLESASNELPVAAARFLQQALESLHAPDGALMLAASAIDAMLKSKGYTEGTLYSRIRSASKDHVLTDDMAAWAHEIRLSANEPRHADENFEGATPDDAEQVIAFAKALGQYLFELPARVKKWQEKATQQA